MEFAGAIVKTNLQALQGKEVQQSHAGTPRLFRDRRLRRLRPAPGITYVAWAVILQTASTHNLRQSFQIFHPL